MYIPEPYNNTSIEEALSFVKENNVGVLVTSNESLKATHIPFTVKEDKLFGHIALNNSQANDLEGKEVMVIFSGANAYISPLDYGVDNAVPTLNYSAVHIYGDVIVKSKKEEVVAILEDLIQVYEPEYKAHWEEKVEHSYKDLLISELVAFEIDINRVEFQEKMSQTKSNPVNLKSISRLEASGCPNAMKVATQMKKHI